jgi:hypothetical protein
LHIKKGRSKFTKNKEIMKLELKHLAPYLPYGLKAVNTYGLLVNVLPHHYINEYGDYLGLAEGCKLVLRPLSDLTKEMYYKLSKTNDSDNFGFWYGRDNSNNKTEYIYHSGYVGRYYYLSDGYERLSYGMIQFLLKNHFDIFNLIHQGLAIDINTLNK